jgi:CDP-glucose 4,6-dehydratase
MSAPFQVALVTGAAGFLGGWLCDQLLDAGVKVVALDIDHRLGSLPNTRGGRLAKVTADVEDLEAISRVMQEHKIEFVFHLAAQALVKLAAQDPLATFRSNIEGTWNVLEAVRNLRNAPSGTVKGVIVASSDKAYGDQTKLPYQEDFPLQGRFPYDVSKSCADLLAQSYFASFHLPVCITRCGNLYGGGDQSFSRVVPGTIRSILRGEAPTIRSDGTPVRDYVYVHDAAKAMMLIASEMVRNKDIHGEAFNISGEDPISVIEIVRKIAELMNAHDIEPIVQGNAPLEIQKQYLSSAKLREKLGWEPEFDLTRGLQATIEWYKGHLADPRQPVEMVRDDR